MRSCLEHRFSLSCLKAEFLANYVWQPTQDLFVSKQYCLDLVEVLLDTGKAPVGFGLAGKQGCFILDQKSDGLL
jgi:hypothetical protein